MLLAHAPERPERLENPYFRSELPASLLIDEVEALWDRIADADDWAPAVLGVFWPHLDDVPRLWARIPSGTAVLLATDHDEPGHRYAETIGAELLDRCEIHRSNPSPSGAPLDLNDTLRAGGRAAVRALIAAGVFHGWH
jgi:hypothetical protein